MATATVNAAEVQELVTRADQAARNGQLASPPGRSAYDLYMRALELDGTNAAAAAGLKSLPVMAGSQFRADVARGDLDGASRMLATVAQLDPASTLLPDLRNTLVGAWTNRAAHYRQIGEPEAAQRASAEARRVAND